MISPHRIAVMSILLLAMACGLAEEAAAIVFSSETANVNRSECYGLKLQGAKGVPDAPSHQYAFKGICKKFVAHIKDGKEDSRSEEVTLWAEAKAEWNGQANTLEESVSLTNPQGPYSGNVMTILKCTKDPIIYKTSCVVLKHSNTTKWEPFSDAALAQKRPILQGKTTLKEATALSMKQASSSPPPPSPGTASVFTLEAEQLVQSNRTSENGGKVAVQPMAGFGSGWSGNAQLFWSGGAVGAVLDLLVDVPTAATYAVELYMT
ncbi:MAG: hypothetical protein ACXW4K_11350, partial [Candidatus Deferrimicrobiaceae bacterium]